MFVSIFGELKFVNELGEVSEVFSLLGSLSQLYDITLGDVSVRIFEEEYGYTETFGIVHNVQRYDTFEPTNFIFTLNSISYIWDSGFSTDMGNHRFTLTNGDYEIIADPTSPSVYLILEIFEEVLAVSVEEFLLAVAIISLEAIESNELELGVSISSIESDVMALVESVGLGVSVLFVESIQVESTFETFMGMSFSELLTLSETYSMGVRAVLMEIIPNEELFSLNVVTTFSEFHLLEEDFVSLPFMIEDTLILNEEPSFNVRIVLAEAIGKIIEKVLRRSSHVSIDRVDLHSEHIRLEMITGIHEVRYHDARRIS